MNIHLRVFQSGVSRGQLGCHFKPTIGGLSNQPPYRLLQHKLSGSLCWRCSPPTKSVRNNIFFPRHALTNAWRTYTSNAGKLGEKYGQKTSSSKSVNLSGMKRLLTLAKPERWKLGGAVCLLLVSSGVSMFVPFGIGKVIDMISEQLRSPSEADKDVLSSRLNSFCGTLVVIFVVGGICNAGRVYLMSVVGQRIARSLRQKVYNAILKQETAFFDRNKTGELVSRLSSDSLIVSSTLTTNVSDGLRSSISVVAGLTMMFYTSTQLSLITLTGVVPPIAFLLVVVGRYIRNINKKVQDSLAKANQVAEERFSNIRVVKTFGHESHERALFSQKLEELVQLAYKEAKVRAGFFGMTGLSGNLMAVSALYFGSPMLANNSITVGQLSSFLLYAAYVSLSISGITGVWGDLNKGLGAGARLWELLDRQPAILSTGGLIPQHAPKGHLEFRDVTFAYPTRPDVEVLQNLSLTLPTGAMTAVVGGSGSGKSTLAALLLRLYDPTTGQIFLDGHLLSDLNWTWLRKHVSYVSQEPVLFSCSIRENIAYGAVSEGTFYNGASQSLPSVTDEQIWGVADIANAKDFISRLPEGLDTVVGERGISLSGGQRQRVAIARALLRNPKVLLLDEATSALDAESERLVQDALEKVMQGRTVLTIAHRLSTVRNADQIAVLDQGRVIELGSYDQLMSKEDSAFHKLVRLQTFQQFSIVS